MAKNFAQLKLKLICLSGKKILLVTIFFCLLWAFPQPNMVFATQIEVQYPTISDQTLTAESKLPDFVLYLFNAGMAVGFLTVFISLVIAGVMFFLSSISGAAKTEAKDRFSGAISGLLILVLTYLITTTINPQLATFNLTPAPEVSLTPIKEKRDPGVYFYAKPKCPNSRVQPHTSSVSDLGSLKKNVESIEFIKDKSASYVSILYENTNFWGKCQYLDPNQNCQPAALSASSASIYKYDFAPNGDGVYFFRNSCFNNSDSNNINALISNCKKNGGGWYKVPNQRGIFVGELQNLFFVDESAINKENPTGCTVPENERDCIKYGEGGTSCERISCPSLGGENISSIVINGDYLVMFVYFESSKDGQDNTGSKVWTSCQEFPTPDDINKTGPQQIKWEKIRNNGGVIPNYVVIIPIQ